MSTPYTLTYSQLKELDPCKDEFASVTAILGDATSWNGKPITAAEARAAGVSMEQVLWAASALARENREIERRLRHWNCDCAARVLAIFEDSVPGDGRPRGAIEAGRLYADGLIGAAARNAAWAAASAAGAGTSYGAAWDASRAATRAAAWDAPWSVAWAAASATSAASSAAEWGAEQDWQFTRLCEWLSDDFAS